MKSVICNGGKDFEVYPKKAMIELLKDLPADVVGFKATGKVTKDDYDNVVFPAIKNQVDAAKTLNAVFVIETALENFTAGAWVQDAWLGLKEFAKWRRVAIVSDDQKIRSFTDKVGHFVPGEYKGFSIGQLPEAIDWVRAA